jgi:hypothetical protein
MKKLVLFLALAAASFGLASCNRGALNYNNKLVEAQKEVINGFSAFCIKMGGTAEENIPQLTPDARGVMGKVDKAIETINKIETPKGAGNLKKAFIEQIGFIKGFCANVVKLGDSNTSLADKLKIQEEMNKSEVELSRLDDNTIRAQKAFASENGFKLEAK